VVYGTLVLAMVVVAVPTCISVVRWRRSRRAGKVAPIEYVGALIFTVLAVVGLLAVGLVSMIALFNARNR
jgi:hypothetical protein